MDMRRPAGLNKSDMTAAAAPPMPRRGQTPSVRFVPVTGELAWAVFGVVVRSDLSGGVCIHELPETRTSLQIMRGGGYWLRETGPQASWCRVPEAAVWGPRLNWCYGYAANPVDVIGLGLSPEGLFALTGQRPGDLVNRLFDLRGHEPLLAGALQAAASDLPEPDQVWNAVLPVLREALAGRPTRPSGASLAPAVPAVRTAVATEARRAGVSERHYRRRLVDEHGFTPKQAQRLQRIDQLLRALHPAPWEGPATLQPEAAFADQAHMIREFKSLTGLTPGAYRRAKEADPGSVIRAVPAPYMAPPAGAPT
jgi:AraC-like DNA-binding protein